MDTPPVTTEPTECCALAQVRAFDGSSIDTIQANLDAAKKNGYRAVFIMTRSHEDVLVTKLKILGFEAITTFHRRKAYDDTLLTMWIKKW